jgi:Sugar (and other) transporter
MSCLLADSHVIVDQGIITALVTMSIAYAIPGDAGSYVELVGLFMYLASYGLGLGPAGWLLPSEIFATSIRAKGVSLATFLNRATATIMVTTFLSLKNTITWPLFFLVLAGFTLFTLVMLYLYLPETKGRSLEDMSLFFAEETGDFSILDAERKLRVENELKQMKDGRKKEGRRKDVTSTTFADSTRRDPSSRTIFESMSSDPYAETILESPGEGTDDTSSSEESEGTGDTSIAAETNEVVDDTT